MIYTMENVGSYINININRNSIETIDKHMKI